MKQLTNKQVTEAYKSHQKEQLDDFLAALERLAQLWKLLLPAKYAYRDKPQGEYSRDIALMVPHRRSSAPFFASLTLLSACRIPYAATETGTKVTKAGKEYF